MRNPSTACTSSRRPPAGRATPRGRTAGRGSSGTHAARRRPCRARAAARVPRVARRPSCRESRFPQNGEERTRGAVERAGGGHRGRRRRLLDPLLVAAARVGRRRPRRARRPDERLDVPLGGARRAASLVPLADEDDDGERRPLPDSSRPRWVSRPDGARSARCGSPRPRSGWRRSRARRAGQRPSDCRSSWSRPRRRRRCSRRCRRTACSAQRSCPTDGYIDPSQLTFALAEGARRRGAEVNTNTRVTGIRTGRGGVTAVETHRGEIETEIVVNAGGMFAGELGALADVACRWSRWRTSTSC